MASTPNSSGARKAFVPKSEHVRSTMNGRNTPGRSVTLPAVILKLCATPKAHVASARLAFPQPSMAHDSRSMESELLQQRQREDAFGVDEDARVEVQDHRVVHAQAGEADHRGRHRQQQHTLPRDPDAWEKRQHKTGRRQQLDTKRVWGNGCATMSRNAFDIAPHCFSCHRICQNGGVGGGALAY